MTNMKKIRTDKFKMTQAEFARAVGVNQSTVNRWEKGSLPSLEQVPKIVSAAKKRRIKMDAAKLISMLNAVTSTAA